MALPKIVFICIENSNRSQMAEAFARLHGGAVVEAFSAGSAPSGRVNPRAAAFMKEKGYDLSSHRSTSLRDLPPGPYDYVVGMGCGDACPWLPVRHRIDWDIPDPKDLDDDGFRRVRDLVEARVKDLLEQVGRR